MFVVSKNFLNKTLNNFFFLFVFYILYASLVPLNVQGGRNPFKWSGGALPPPETLRGWRDGPRHRPEIASVLVRLPFCPIGTLSPLVPFVPLRWKCQGCKRFVIWLINYVSTPYLGGHLKVNLLLFLLLLLLLLFVVVVTVVVVAAVVAVVVAIRVKTSIGRNKSWFKP